MAQLSESRAVPTRVGWALASAGLVVALAAAPGLAPGTGNTSSHREAPLIAADPQVDNTDVYAFVSPDDSSTVTVIANWIPFQEPNGGPNFYPFATGARYDVNIDNNGDGKADITYRWVFKNEDKRAGQTFLYNNGPVESLNDENLLFRQTYTLERIEGNSSRMVVEDGIAAPSNAGPASMPDYASLRDEAITTFGDGARTFAGQADDPFFLDLRVFDLLYGANLEEVGTDTTAGFNVNTIALQVPKGELALNGDADGNPVIGVWSSTSRRSVKLSPGKAEPTGNYVQVSRLGNPLVNEVVVPVALKDAFNSITPDKDHTVQAVVDRVTDPEVPRLIEGIYGVEAPATPREDLVEIFLTGICKACGPIKADLNSQMLNKDVKKKAFVPSEELRLNMSVPSSDEPSRLGVLGGDLQGFPNGRRLTDDVVDIELQALVGAAMTGKLVDALGAGDGVDENDVAFDETFPYVALPHTSAVTASSHASSAAAVPTGGANAGGGGTVGAVSRGLPATLLVVVLAGLLALGAVLVRLLRRERS